MFAQLLTTQRSLKYFYVFKLLKQFCNSQIKINFEQMPALAFAFAFEKALCTVQNYLYKAVAFG